MTVSLVSHRPPQRSTGPGRGESHGQGGAVARPPASAASAPLRVAPQPEGLLQVHTAPFRGSVAAVFSQALRSAGLGSRVLVSQFLKGGVDQGVAGSLQLCDRLQWLRPAMPLCIEEPFASAADPPLAAAAREAVTEVWLYSRQRLLEGSVDLMVLDELGLAVELGYLPGAEVIATFERRPPHLDVIVTGPAMPAALMAMADQVTQLRRCG